MHNSTTITDVLGFITDHADQRDLEAVLQAYKTRIRILRDRDAAAVRVGAQVTLDDLSPRYLNGITGLVKEIRGQRCTVTVTNPDHLSTLRFMGRRRFFVPVGAESYDLSGIPLSSAKVGA